MSFLCVKKTTKSINCGRGEVASFVFRIIPMSHVTFSPFFVIDYFKHSL